MRNVPVVDRHQLLLDGHGVGWRRVGLEVLLDRERTLERSSQRIALQKRELVDQLVAFLCSNQCVGLAFGQVGTPAVDLRAGLRRLRSPPHERATYLPAAGPTRDQ